MASQHGVSQNGSKMDSSRKAQGGGQRGTQNQAEGQRKGQSRAEDATQERDEVYNVVSVLYHALQGAETYAKYVRDAEQAGDDELADFFRDVQIEEVDRAERAKELLAMRLSEYVDVEDDDEGEDDDEEDVTDKPS